MTQAMGASRSINQNECPNPACERSKPRDKAFCLPCWRDIPIDVQKQIYNSYRDRDLYDHVDFLVRLGERLAAGAGDWPEARAVTDQRRAPVYRSPVPPKIDLEFCASGWCVEKRPLHSYVADLDWMLEYLASMGEGLDRPWISLEVEAYVGNEDAVLYVCGRRPLTAEEQGRIQGQLDATREAELAELAALRAKYPDA